MPLQNLNLKPRPPKGKGTRRRLLGLSALSAVTAAVYLLSMMRIQIVDGARYLEETLSTTLSVIPVRAARGEILDRDGEALAENRTGMNIVFYYSFFPQERAAEQIAALIALCEENGESWYDPLPLNEDGTAFTEGSETSVEALREALGLSSYATADDCLYRLCERYGIEEEDPVLRRKIAGACYGMLVREFSLTNNEYTFAQDISLTTALQLKERSRELPGVDIAEEDIRSYPDGTTAPHLIGTVGSMSAEEWETYREEGYQMSDFVGKFGIERYCESVLRGTDGERTVEQGGKRRDPERRGDGIPPVGQLGLPDDRRRLPAAGAAAAGRLYPVPAGHRRPRDRRQRQRRGDCGAGCPERRGAGPRHLPLLRYLHLL